MIIISVDNKLRDFPPLLRLATNLKKLYKKPVILSSFFDLQDLVISHRNKIDCVLLSYAKKNNSFILETIKRTKVRTFVYDQEGAGGFDGHGLNKVIKKNIQYIKDIVDVYFFWGSAQLKKNKKILDDINVKTDSVGYLRFSNFINHENKIKYENFYLINSNFAITSPRYNSKKKEYNEIKASGIYGNSFTTFMNDMYKREKVFYNEINKIVKNNPKRFFVIRPHPFEDISNAKKISDQYKNCILSLSHNSTDWIVKCKAVIHLDCMTSIECIKFKKPALSLYWIYKNDKFYYKIPSLSSVRCSSISNLQSKFKEIESKKYKHKISGTEIVKRFFGNLSTRNSEQFSEKIIWYINNIKKRKENVLFTDFEIRTQIKIIFKRYLNEKIFFIVWIFFAKWRIFYKYTTQSLDNKLLDQYLPKNKYKKYYGKSYLVK